MQQFGFKTITFQIAPGNEKKLFYEMRKLSTFLDAIVKLIDNEMTNDEFDEIVNAIVAP